MLPRSDAKSFFKVFFSKKNNHHETEKKHEEISESISGVPYLGLLIDCRKLSSRTAQQQAVGISSAPVIQCI